MKVAFTSCFDVLDDNVQNVWGEVAKQNPDVLLLLGDSIYMDFGLPVFSDHPLGKPQKWDPQRFAEEMYRRYNAQSRVHSFQDLVESIGQAGAIWDDHDFGWNGASGMGTGWNVVSPEKKLIARGLHMQFREWLRTRPLPATYPTQPSMDSLLSGSDIGIEEFFDIDTVRFVMLDGRYYRDEVVVEINPYDGRPERRPESTSLLGQSQRDWLAEKINEWTGLNIICSGSTLTGRSDAWEQYLDLAWLAEQHFRKTIVLTGDIHNIASKRHKSLGNLWEFTASGAARPGIGGGSGNFGILNIAGGDISVELFDEDGLDKTKSVNP